MDEDFKPQQEEPIEVPWEALSPEALRGVVEHFVLREGTDYGEQEFLLEDKVAQVMEQLRKKEARVMFDPNTETVDIIVRAQIKILRPQEPESREP